jgi:cold shock CspA family protein
MALKKQSTPKRWRSREAREIARAVELAGGTVERTANGHLKVTGPEGVAVVASAPDTGHQGGRALANTWATITRETGLIFPPVQPEKPRGDKETEPPKRPASSPSRQARHGVITRWEPGDTYGFITSADGDSWFVSRDSLPDGVTELTEGTPVTFSGSAKPRAGKGYPEALRIEVAAEQ